MSTGVAVALLFLGTVLWFLLPLLPALRELFRPTDIMPLQVVGRDAGDVALFARGFQAYVTRQLERLPTDSTEELLGKLPDGTPFVRARRLAEPLVAEAMREEGLDRVVVLTGPASFAGGQTFLREVYARAALAGGPGSIYRALLGDAGLALGPGSTVLRWVHARGELLVGDGSLLAGRASSDQAIRLGQGVSFDRLAAPRIVVGGGSTVPDSVAVPAAPLDLPLDRARQVGDHLRIEGDLVIPAGAVVGGHLVVTGTLRIGPGARLTGNVKAHRAIEIGAGAVLEGAVVSRAQITTDLRARVAGPLVAEAEVSVGPGSVIGDPQRPTSLACPRVVLGAGVTVHGLITATAGGSTAEQIYAENAPH
jgi:carbonic anhydrase/acetyltransferase-like protein (isoleucine patch superfamily)